MTVREPLGVAAMICPWNFPIGMPARKISAALAGGDHAGAGGGRPPSPHLLRPPLTLLVLQGKNNILSKCVPTKTHSTEVNVFC